MTDFNSPNNNSFTSLAAFSPSARSVLSIFFDRSTASFSPELIVQPIVNNKRTSQKIVFKSRTQANQIKRASDERDTRDKGCAPDVKWFELQNLKNAKNVDRQIVKTR